MNTVIKTIFHNRPSRTLVTNTNVIGVRISGKVKNKLSLKIKKQGLWGWQYRTSGTQASLCPLISQSFWTRRFGLPPTLLLHFGLFGRCDHCKTVHIFRLITWYTSLLFGKGRKQNAQTNLQFDHSGFCHLFIIKCDRRSNHTWTWPRQTGIPNWLGFWLRIRENRKKTSDQIRTTGNSETSSPKEAGTDFWTLRMDRKFCWIISFWICCRQRGMTVLSPVFQTEELLPSKRLAGLWQLLWDKRFSTTLPF